MCRVPTGPQPRGMVHAVCALFFRWADKMGFVNREIEEEYSSWPDRRKMLPPSSIPKYGVPPPSDWNWNAGCQALKRRLRRGTPRSAWSALELTTHVQMRLIWIAVVLITGAACINRVILLLLISWSFLPSPSSSFRTTMLFRLDYDDDDLI